MFNSVRQFPRQKLPFKSKNKSWRKLHLDWADEQGRLFSETIRKRMYNKKININLYNGKVNKDDIKLTLNPNNLDDFYIPDNIQHYPIVTPRIDVLVGEESDRRFDWTVRIINPTAVSEIETEKKKLISQKIEELIRMKYSEEEVEKELARFDNYINFEWQDIREKRANLLLKHYVKELDVQYKFSEGFKDALLVAEEGYLCDIRHNEPTFEKLNPLKTYVIQHGYSNRYEDASIIVIDDYWSPGKLVDEYHDKLTPADIEYILNSGKVNHGARAMNGDTFKEDIDDRKGIEIARGLALDLDMFIDSVDDVYPNFNARDDYFDTEGNIRVLRVFWRSYKSIKVVSYPDPQTGETLIKYRDENYVHRPELGEEVETRWVSQWWQGLKAGEKVYTDMRPRPIQYNKLSNPGYNTPGIVGQIYNTNDQKAVSLMDQAKVFNYLFDGAFHRLMETYSKFLGPILEIDKAKFPEGWDLTKSLFFAKKAGVLLIDSFKEGKKGMATGKLAGAVGNTSGKIYNSDIGGYIEQHLSFMEYCKVQMDEIIGVPKQRLGQVEKRETVGGVDTAIRQGNYVTAMLYKKHDDVKKRALTLLLETAKIAGKGNKLKMSYVADDYSNQIMEIDGDEIAEMDYGLEVTNDSDNLRLEQNLTQLAHAALQNQTLSFSTIMKIFTSPSLVEIQRLIEKDERDTIARTQEAADKENQIKQNELDKKEALETRKLDIDEFDITERSRIEELKLIMDSSNEEVQGMSEGEAAKLALDRKKHLDYLKLDMQKREDDMTKHDDKMEIEKKKLNKPQANAS